MDEFVTPDPLEGLPPDLVRVLRDPSILVPQDAAVFELISKWMDAPSNTASAMSAEEWQKAWSTLWRRYEAIVTQHHRVWSAVTKDGGMRLPSREGWRDANWREWDVWVGPMVECPRCAFTFGIDHTDEGGGYSCPNCDYDGHVEEEPTS